MVKVWGGYGLTVCSVQGLKGNSGAVQTAQLDSISAPIAETLG